MPQGHRKVPFSAKQKKQQLQEKRLKKGRKRYGDDLDEVSDTAAEGSVNVSSQQPEVFDVSKLNLQFSFGGKADPNRYVLQFRRETDAELKQRRKQAREIFEPVPPEETEIDIDDYFPPELDFPKRPPWDFSMSREQLDVYEQNCFREYILRLQRCFKWSELSYFELNLETWRQLWRVLEMSDIILLIVDIRYPALMFPPSVYQYVTEHTGKNMILVLNKIDLAPAPLVVAWKHYFKTKFPSLHVLAFTSFPLYNLHGNIDGKSGTKNRKIRGRLRMAAEGAQKLMEACQDIAGDKVNLESWRKKIKEEMLQVYEDEDLEIEETVQLDKVDTSYHEHVQFKDGIVTIGCIGQPNAGKSSVMNAIMGKKVVSVSKTPGHTKHFQTIFLTENVKLCDCPGLVFPSKVPKPLQILMGSYPIAQVREPYTTIRYLAERLDIIRMLHIKHPDDDDSWCAIDICDGWAKARGFTAARSGRPDTYRAANHILRMALDGKICLCLKPVGYLKKEAYWASHPDVKEILWIQARDKSDSKTDCDTYSDEGAEPVGRGSRGRQFGPGRHSRSSDTSESSFSEDDIEVRSSDSEEN